MSKVKYVVNINEVGLDVKNNVAIKLGITGCDVSKFTTEEPIDDV